MGFPERRGIVALEARAAPGWRYAQDSGTGHGPTGGPGTQTRDGSGTCDRVETYRDEAAGGRGERFPNP